MNNTQSKSSQKEIDDLITKYQIVKHEHIR